MTVIDKTVDKAQVLEDRIEERGEEAGLKRWFLTVGGGESPVAIGLFRTWRTGWWIFGKDHKKLVIKVNLQHKPVDVKLYDEDYRHLADKISKLLEKSK